ncbi:hypothetical protein AgCh_003170 [Apium graveolens]
MASSNINYVWGWLYCDGNIIHDNIIGSTYDRDVVAFVKLNFGLKYEELVNVVYKKLNIDPNMFRLRVSRRFMNPITNKYGVVLLVDDDDLEYMFEFLDGSGSQCARGSVSSGSSSRNLVGSSVGSEENSRESNELTDSDIPYYRSFDATSMVVSNQKHDMLKIGEVKNPIKLTKGMIFESKDKFMNVVKKVHIVNHLEIKVVKSDSVTWEVAISQNHLKYSYIADMVMDLVAADPTVSEKVLMAAIVKEVGYKPSSKKVVRFRRLFWKFKPCIDAFTHCIPVLQIDGTHLSGKYRGVLLTATTIDGFHHILPVAFAVVEGENVSSWTWFMDRVRKTVALRQMGVCVISDGHT